MALRINHNVTSLNAYSNLSSNSSKMESSIKKLSSGLRINSAADDASGLAMSEKIRSQISGLNRAKLNTQDGMSMIQTAEGGLNETESMIQRMRELAVQASNDTLTSNDRLEIQKEVNQLAQAINDVADSTEFNTKKLLNGSQTAQLSSSSQFINGLVTGNASSGGDFNVRMEVVQGGISQTQTSQMFRDKNTGEIAKGSTKLEDIAQFYDVNGTFTLSSQQKLTVSGNAKSTEITVDGKMTLNELASSLQNAIAGASNVGLSNSTVEFIEGDNVKTGGYLELTSGVVGEEGNFSIAGSQDLVDALGITVSRESANNVVKAKITTVNGDSRTVTTSSDRLSGLLDGMDIQFESSAAQIAGRGGIVDGMTFTAAEDFEFTYQVGDSVQTVKLTFGADSNWSMEGIAAELNKQIEADSPNSGMEATVVDGQIRLSYNHPTDVKSPTSITITKGSENLGLLKGTYAGFVEGDKKMENAVTGISLLSGTKDKDLGFTVNGKKITVGETITSGADLILSDEFIRDSNNALAQSTAHARLDIVNGSLAITSTILGKDNANNLESRLTVTMADAAGAEYFNIQQSSIARGAGDTDFRVHVINNKPQFQIGANQGQQMNISIGDMSAKALDIDKLDMSTTEGAQSAIGKLDNALSKVSAERSKLGSYSNRLSYTMNNLENASTNLTEAESRIRDLDMASEMIKFTSSQILNQAGTAMLSQANAMGQSVLSLLG